MRSKRRIVFKSKTGDTLFLSGGCYLGWMHNGTEYHLTCHPYGPRLCIADKKDTPLITGDGYIGRPFGEQDIRVYTELLNQYQQTAV